MRLTSTQSKAYSDTLKLLRNFGRDDDARHLKDYVVAQDEASEIPTIVVVGEVKRGKSTLVNALVGRPDLSPVGIEVVTAGFVRLVPPSDDLPEGTAQLVLADHTRRRIPATDVARWLTAGDAPADAADVVAIGAEVAVVPRWLPQVVLVDTPGVGGLDSGHARLARQAAKKASALLVVTDAGQVLTAPELAFLRDASSSIDAVVFALTKTDRHPLGSGEVLAENRRLLEQHAPRFAQAPIVPVSATLALAAQATADDSFRQALEEASGLPVLAAELSARVADTRRLAARNVLRAAHSALADLEQEQRDLLAAVDATPEERDALLEERRHYEELGKREMRWSLDLERDLGDLRRKTIDDISARVEARREQWLQRIKGERQGLRAGVAQQYAAELDSDLAVLAEELGERFNERLRDLLVRVFAGLDPAGLSSGLGAGVDLRRTPLSVTRRTSVRGGLLDPTAVGTTLLGVNMAGQFGLVGASTAALLSPWALLIGGAYLGANLFYKSVRQGREQLTQVLADTMRGAETALIAAVDTAIREVKPEIMVTFRDVIKARTTELKNVLAAADRAARADKQQRDTQRTSAAGKVAAIAQVIALVDATLRDEAGTPAPVAASNERHPAEPAGERHE
jgi:hypothetical protein